MRSASRLGSKLCTAGLAFLVGACGDASGAEESVSATGASSGEAELPRFGIVALGSKYASAGEGPKAFADAFFWRAAGEGETGCRVVESIGACEVSECLPTTAVPPASGFAWVSAGTIDISGTTLGFSFEETKPGWYVSTLPDLERALWEGGELLTAIVQGSDQYPPARATLTAPHAVTLTKPADRNVSVDPRADLEFAWASPREDRVYVDVKEIPGVLERPPLERSVRCAFPAVEGAGVVPAAALARLTSPELLSGYRLFVSTSAEARITIEQATLTFSVWSRSFRADASVKRPE